MAPADFLKDDFIHELLHFGLVRPERIVLIDLDNESDGLQGWSARKHTKVAAKLRV